MPVKSTRLDQVLSSLRTSELSTKDKAWLVNFLGQVKKQSAALQGSIDPW